MKKKHAMYDPSAHDKEDSYGIFYPDVEPFFCWVTLNEAACNVNEPNMAANMVDGDSHSHRRTRTISRSFRKFHDQYDHQVRLGCAVLLCLFVLCAGHVAASFFLISLFPTFFIFMAGLYWTTGANTRFCHAFCQGFDEGRLENLC